MTLQKMSFRKVVNPQTSSTPHDKNFVLVIVGSIVGVGVGLGNFAHTSSVTLVISNPISSHSLPFRGKIMKIIQAMLWHQNNINLNKHL